MIYSILLTSMLLLQPLALESPVAIAPRHGGIYVVAHRGVHSGIPENTLAAFRKAIEVGADFVEIDVRETKDKQLVSVHNHEVDAYTKDAVGAVQNYTLAELKAMDIGGRVGEEWKEERIPTLEEILELCHDKIGIYLDFKYADMEDVVALIRKYDMTDKVIWYVGGLYLRQLIKHCPECVPMPDPGAERNLQRILDTVKPKFVASTWRHISESFVKTCHDAGALVIVDDGGPETWDSLLAWGVDGIQSDDVEALIEHLREYKQGDASVESDTD
ncbi:MAG: glycerophosphodiester phosphodiesterase family protein [Candidatus Hydrogenedentes bacterium]|nr:glycerophosphodiester phosphodiesterase family protein [Candidatus Hydrogenedentota bacterium]